MRGLWRRNKAVTCWASSDIYRDEAVGPRTMCSRFTNRQYTLLYPSCEKGPPFHRHQVVPTPSLFLKRSRLIAVRQLSHSQAFELLFHHRHLLEIERFLQQPSTDLWYHFPCSYAAVLHSLRKSPFPFPPVFHLDQDSCLVTSIKEHDFQVVFAEWVTAPLIQGTRPFLLTPHLLHWLQEEDLGYVTLMAQTILRMIYVVRTPSNYIAPPTSPCCALYRHLPTILSVFTCEDLKKVDFQEGLRSFLQLLAPHFFLAWDILQKHFQDDPELSRLFPQVYEMVQHRTILSFVLEDGVSIPGHLFFYGMMVHPHIRSEMKRMIFFNLHVKRMGRRPKPRKRTLPPTILTHTPLSRLLSSLEESTFTPSSIPLESIPQMRPIRFVDVHLWMINPSQSKPLEMLPMFLQYFSSQTGSRRTPCSHSSFDGDDHT